MHNEWDTGLFLDLVDKFDGELWVGASWELVGTVGGTDGNGEGVDASEFDELLGLDWVSELDVTGDIFFNTTECAEFSFNGDTEGVSIFNNFLGDADVLFEGEVGSINHDRSETEGDGLLDGFYVITVVEVDDDWDFWVLDSSGFHELPKVDHVGILEGTTGGLDDDWRLGLGSSIHDGLDLFHVVDVVGTNTVVLLFGYS